MPVSGIGSFMRVDALIDFFRCIKAEPHPSSWLRRPRWSDSRQLRRQSAQLHRAVVFCAPEGTGFNHGIP
jgi:hypothetical protein